MEFRSHFLLKLSTKIQLLHLYFQKSILSHGFPSIVGSNGMPGMPGVPDRKNYREGKARKDRSGIREHGECRDHGETEGVKGLLGRAGY